MLDIILSEVLCRVQNVLSHERRSTDWLFWGTGSRSKCLTVIKKSAGSWIKSRQTMRRFVFIIHTLKKNIFRIVKLRIE
jgi:hypothetical protein